MKLALQLVTYNGAEYLPYLFSSLISQNDRDWTLYVIDNASTERDRIRRVVHEAQKEIPVVYLETEENLGFAGGHQKLFTMHNADLVQLINPDVILTPDYLVRMRAYMETNETTGSAAGNIYRWDWEDGEPGLSNVIDSLGITQSRHGSISDRGAGELKLDSSSELLGVSGCLPMYRREAVEESSMNRELFDPRYHTYKEDVDLAFRLGRASWEVGIVSDSIAHHRREVRKGTKREHISYTSQFHSFRNHWWNLLTHTSAGDMVKRGWAILLYELAKTVYLMLMHPSIVFRTVKETYEYFPVIKKKRSWYGTRTR